MSSNSDPERLTINFVTSHNVNSLPERPAVLFSCCDFRLYEVDAAFYEGFCREVMLSRKRQMRGA